MSLPKCLGIITARGGSKGVKDKAIRNISGKSVLAYTILTALKCRFIDDIIVSTDSQKIQEIALKYKTKCPFLRPEHLSTDLAHQEDAIIHTMEWYESNVSKPDYICLLEPTVPLRKVNTLLESFEYIYGNSNIKSLFSVTKSADSPVYINTLRDDRTLKDFIPKKYIWSNRQELPDYYKLSSLITICEWDTFYSNRTFLTDQTHYIVVDPIESIDIDEPLDYILDDYLISNSISSVNELNEHVNEFLLKSNLK